MDTKVTALNGQSLADICLQETGTIAGLFELAMANGKSITDVPEPGERLVIPESIETVREVRNYFKAHNIRPVTGLEVPEPQTLFEMGLFEMGLFD